jgi:hypothetical protein
MSRHRTQQTATVAALVLAGTAVLGACGANSDNAGTGTMPSRTPGVWAGPTPTSSGGDSSTAPAAGTPTVGPTSGWGPSAWSGGRGSGMMGDGSGSWGPDMMGPGMMGNWWLAGDGNQVRTLDAARQRATAFANRLGLRVGEIMRFSRNFYAELETTGGRPATEVLVNPADGAVQIEYGPAMMWNTEYGLHSGRQGRTRISAAQARSGAQRWLHGQDGALTAGDPEAYPGYYTLHSMKSGKITGMLSVNAYTGQVWYHSWHGAFLGTSRR